MVTSNGARQKVSNKDANILTLKSIFPSPFAVLLGQLMGQSPWQLVQTDRQKEVRDTCDEERDKERWKASTRSFRGPGSVGPQARARRCPATALPRFSLTPRCLAKSGCNTGESSSGRRPGPPSQEGAAVPRTSLRGNVPLLTAHVCSATQTNLGTSNTR